MATKDVRDSPVWCEQQFDAFHKDKGGNISWTVFESFCNEVCGEFHVAIKFMRSRQSSDRELNIRDGVESKYVVPTLPCDQNAIERNVASLTLAGVDDMAEYKYAIVMPYANLHLADLLQTESAAEKRLMLKHVAEALKELHDKGVVHGDLTKYDVVFMNGRYTLVDLDAGVSMDEPLGVKFSSGILPPEMFHEFEHEDERAVVEAYWKEHGVPHLCRVRPSHAVAVKSTHDAGADDLPYDAVEAGHAADAWAFGCLMFQVLTGEELIPTVDGKAQDIHPDHLDFIVTYDAPKLDDRLKLVTNKYAVRLLKKLLAEAPEDRPTMTTVIKEQYFTNLVSQKSLFLGFDKLQIDQLQVQEKLEAVNKLAEENNRKLKEQTAALIKVIEKTKKTLLQAALQVNEVTVPTSFIVLPEEILANDDVKKNKDEGDNLLKYLIDTAKTFKNAFENTAVMANELKKLAGGRPMYFYLIDEVTQLPVTGTGYPIELVGETSEYATFASNCMPFIQGGFQLIKKANNVARMFKVLGMPSLDKDLVTKAGETIDSM
ncbi:hypothetical protein As57867_006300, partial [Aphanomyces stellatus]